MKMTLIEKRFVNRRKKSERNIKKFELALKYIDMKKIKTILELGCGIGFVSHYLAVTYNLKVYGTDYDDNQIQFMILKKLLSFMNLRNYFMNAQRTGH